jgi:hypothetical protein
MKINAESNGCVQFRATTAAVKTLKLQPFTKLTSHTARGNLITPTGNGWYWISRFDTQVLPILQDLEALEAAEKSLAIKGKFA